MYKVATLNDGFFCHSRMKMYERRVPLRRKKVSVASVAFIITIMLRRWSNCRQNVAGY
jgi:hypothetical protein